MNTITKVTTEYRVRQIVENWPRDLGASCVLRPLKGGTSSTCWRADTPTGTYFVKVATCRATRLREQYRVIAALKDAGASTILPIVVAGEPYLRAGRERYEIFPFVRATKRIGRQQWSSAVGGALARLHIAFGSVQAKCGAQLAPMPDAQREFRLRIAEATRLVYSRLPLFLEDRQARLLGDRLLALVDAWYSRLAFFRDSIMPKLANQPIHGDFQPQNVLSVSKSECVIIDFAKLAYGPAVFDLAKMISCACFNGTDHPRFEKVTAAALIAAYDEVKSLTELERQSMPCLVLMNQLSGLWVIEEYFMRGNSRVGPLIDEYVRRLVWLGRHASDLFALSEPTTFKYSRSQQRLALRMPAT